MKKSCIFMMLIFTLIAGNTLAEQDCIMRKDFADKHVIRYRAYNNTIRGCVVTGEFYTQQHKMKRGNLSRKYIIEVCEGDPRTSPRIGKSFRICPHQPKKKINEEEKQ